MAADHCHRNLDRLLSLVGFWSHLHPNTAEVHWTVPATVTGWIADRREAGQRVRGRPCEKCSVAVATPSQGCITSSHTEKVGGGKLRSAKLPTVIPKVLGLRSPSQKTLLPARSGSQCHEVVLPQFESEMKADLEAALRVTLLYQPEFRSSVNHKSRFQRSLTIIPIVVGNFSSKAWFSNG